MMKKMGRLAALAVAGMMAFGGSICTYAAEAIGPGVVRDEEANVEKNAENAGERVMQGVTQSGIQTAQKDKSGIDIARLEAAQEAGKVIVVVGTGMDSARITAAYFKKAEDGSWNEEFYVPGYCGFNGMAIDKKEGDRRTPVGTYGFTKAFGILDDPGSILPYKVLDEDDYWVDDGSSRYYNQMVSAKTMPVTWKSAEHLIKVNPCYNYSLALDYNAACVPGKGSAIFLHGLHPTKTWTEGCIAIPEENMKTLIQQVDEDTRIVVVPDASQLVYTGAEA